MKWAFKKLTAAFTRYGDPSPTKSVVKHVLWSRVTGLELQPGSTSTHCQMYKQIRQTNMGWNITLLGKVSIQTLVHAEVVVWLVLISQWNLRNNMMIHQANHQTFSLVKHQPDMFALNSFSLMFLNAITETLRTQTLSLLIRKANIEIL